MPVGNTVLGSALEIEAATTTGPVGGVYTPGTYEPVSDMNRIDFNANRPVTNIAVFMRTTQYAIPGVREQTITLAGFVSAGDTGQGILDTAHENDDVIALRVLRDGTNGYFIICRVGSRRESAAPEGLQEVSYDLLAISDKTTVP